MKSFKLVFYENLNRVFKHFRKSTQQLLPTLRKTHVGEFCRHC